MRLNQILVVGGGVAGMAAATLDAAFDGFMRRRF
jgi:hypothetical protein